MSSISAPCGGCRRLPEGGVDGLALQVLHGHPRAEHHGAALGSGSGSTGAKERWTPSAAEGITARRGPDRDGDAIRVRLTLAVDLEVAAQSSMSS
jgi:hypothetical protein